MASTKRKRLSSSELRLPLTVIWRKDYEEEKEIIKDLFEKLLKSGFVRAKVDGQMSLIEDFVEDGLDKNKKHTSTVPITARIE